MKQFVVFHTGAGSLPTYLPLMRAGKRALQVTNPGAEYIVLTDKETAPHLDTEFDVFAIAPSGEPLMRQFVIAQAEYEARYARGLTVLAGTDCVANKNLDDALKHDMAITYRLRGKHLINNIAYVHDHEKAAWFLNKALGIMEPKYYDFWGDQKSWSDLVGPVESWRIAEDSPEEDGEYAIRVACVDGSDIHLYPCRKYNYFSKRSCQYRGVPSRAYLLHFKGSRKADMVEFVETHITGKEHIPGTSGGFKGDKQLLPMHQRRREWKRHS